MRKKYGNTVLAFVVAFGLISTSAAAQDATAPVAQPEPQYDIEFQLDRATPVDSLEQLEQRADFIVQAEIVEVVESVKHADYAEGFTVTKIKLDKIYASTNRVSGYAFEGNTLLIKEPYFVYTDAWGKRIKYTKNGYEPSKAGEKFYFFLKYSPNGENNAKLISPEINAQLFNVLGAKARYPYLDDILRDTIDVENIKEADVSLNGVENFDQYKTFYGQILDKYK